jgi:hypothetical protein
MVEMLRKRIMSDIINYKKSAPKNKQDPIYLTGILYIIFYNKN